MLHAFFHVGSGFSGVASNPILLADFLHSLVLEWLSLRFGLRKFAFSILFLTCVQIGITFSGSFLDSVPSSLDSFRSSLIFCVGGWLRSGASVSLDPTAAAL